MAPEALEALEEIRRVLVPDGRLALNVFGPLEHHPATMHLPSPSTARWAPLLRWPNAASTRWQRPANCARCWREPPSETGRSRRHSSRSTSHRPPSTPAQYVRIQLAATPMAGLIAREDAASREHLVEALVEAWSGMSWQRCCPLSRRRA